MALDARRAANHDRPAVQRAVGEGRTLAAAMPRLILEARQVAATVLHGLHGRRRAGPGENFWQYRRFVSGEPASRVDWRRSARDDHLYVREQEWEAAHTVGSGPIARRRWCLPRRWYATPSFTAHCRRAGARRSSGRRRRARRHSGPMLPTGSRNVVERMAQAIMHDRNERTSLPANFSPPRWPRSC